MTIEVKPIVVIYYLPNVFVPPSGKRMEIYDVNQFFKIMFDDYHTLAIPSFQSADGSCEDVRLEVFHPKDFTETDYKSLEELIKKSIEEIKTNQK